MYVTVRFSGLLQIKSEGFNLSLEMHPSKVSGSAQLGADTVQHPQYCMLLILDVLVVAHHTLEGVPGDGSTLVAELVSSVHVHSCI